MRVIKSYRFSIGTKIPYWQWPEIVHHFLETNQLTSSRFLYHFTSYVTDTDLSEPRKKTGCEKLLKDCPSLGAIRFHNGAAHRQSDVFWLSNMDNDEAFPEETLLPLMKKIHRTYGLHRCALFYYDIDFFGQTPLFQLDHTIGRKMSEATHSPFDPSDDIQAQPYGSGIALHRDVCANNYLDLSIDVLHDGVLLDATPYYKSMQTLLPNIRSSETLQIYLTEEEQAHIQVINESAAPILEQCREFLKETLPFTPKQNHFPSRYSVAKPLRKLAKKYGYTYHLTWSGGIYLLTKKTASGNMLAIEFDSGPSHFDLSAELAYYGPAFCHQLGSSSQNPAGQQEANAYLEQLLSTVSQFERTLLSALDQLFPEAPDWFTLSD